MFKTAYRIAFFSLFSLSNIAFASAPEFSIHIDRKARMFYVLDAQHTIVIKTPCGIGKGGIKDKKNMADLVTPTGEFEVDLILYEKEEYNKISKESQSLFRNNDRYWSLVKDTSGLKRLRENMNTIDFNQDRKADLVYGIAYIGLNSASAVSGPKLIDRGDIPYWFSIAIHGTPQSDKIGQAGSGGCIHLLPENLSKLVEQNFVQIGTKVKISDSAP